MPSAGDQPFHRHFPSRDVRFDQKPVGSRLAEHLNLWRFHQQPNPPDRLGKFIWIVRSYHALARRKRKRFHDARKFHPRHHISQAVRNRKRKKVRHPNARRSKRFALPQFAPADFRSRRRVPRNPQRLRRICRCHCRPIAKRDYRSDLFFARRISRFFSCRTATESSRDLQRRVLRILEMQRERIITPRILQFMAAISAKPHFDSQLLRRLRESESLIA